MGKVGGMAFAYAEELDEWVRRNEGIPREAPSTPTPEFHPPLDPPPLESQLLVGNQLPPPSNRSGLFLALSAFLAVTFAAWFALRPGPTVPAAFRLTKNVLQVVDSEGKPIWQKTFPDLDEQRYVQRHSEEERFGVRFGLIANLGGERDLLFVYFPKHGGAGSTLYCYRPDGKVAWLRQLGRTVETENGSTIFSMYDTSQIVLLHHPRPDGGVIVVGSHHDYSWVEHVAILTALGKEVAEYWHPGWIYKLEVADLRHNGQDVILLGGVNDGYQGTGYGPTLVALDPNRVYGQSASAPRDVRHRIRRVSPAQEAAVLLFPDYDRTHPDPNVYLRVAGLKYLESFVDLEISADAVGEPVAHYELDPQLRVRSITTDPHLLELLAPKLHGPESEEVAHQILANVLTLRNRFLNGR